MSVLAYFFANVGCIFAVSDDKLVAIVTVNILSL